MPADKPLVTVIITVGPDPCYKEYVKEAVQSVLDQTYKVYDLLIIDDQANLDPYEIAMGEITYSSSELCLDQVDRFVWEHNLQFYHQVASCTYQILSSSQVSLDFSI